MGNKILIPQQIANIPVGVVRGTDYPITQGLSETEKDLGVDLLLTPENDLALTVTNDLKLTAGLSNMAQALVVRILIEKGSLKRHPGIGTKLQVGKKTSQNSVSDLKAEILTSLGSDPRITSIPFIQLSQESGTININMLVRIKHFEEPVPIPLAINL